MKLYSSYPSIDLHGMDRQYAVFKVDEFLTDNSKLKTRRLIIIHGIGSGILKNAVHGYLRRSKLVKEYKLDNFNSGQTIVELK